MKPLQKVRQVAGLLSVLALLATPAAAQITEAAVTGGEVKGIVLDNTGVFLGIPFAAPPVGDNRWRAPQPVQKWTGIKEVKEFGPACMQDPRMAEMMRAPTPPSEDCLYLNVWTPATSTKAKLPVMVWIHGGGFSMGVPSEKATDGLSFAKNGVILVSIPYRLGLFGFMAHPELSAESRKGSGTYGNQDQIAGLQWVQDNIAQFGGDPNNVTIFGESAGAISVSMLTASPKAKGLFDKAISQSGGNFGTPTPLAESEANGAAYFKTLGVSTLAEARALSPEQLLSPPGSGSMGRFWPALDGHVLTGDQYLLYQKGKFNDTPVLIGTNADEGGMFVPQGNVDAFKGMVAGTYASTADAILAAYPHATDAEATRSMQNLFRDSAFGWPTWAWAQLQKQHGKGKVFVYYLERKTPEQPNGAPHALDVQFVYGNPAMFNPNTPVSEADWELARQMQGYWVNFAKTGNPNGEGLPQWPEYTLQDQKVMSLAPTQPIDFPNMTQVKAMDAHFAARRAAAKAQ